MKKLSTDQFRERLLSVMDRKHHWAWPHFSGRVMTKDQLKIHFRQEYAVYVRDFPVLLARIHGKNPPPDVRCMLAANIYEEETGGLSVGRSHPDLFLAMMAGLGYDLAEFRDVTLLPASRAYRQWLDTVSLRRDWMVGAAALTIFVEGSVNDRREILHPSSPKTPAEIEDIVKKHPLVVYHGLSPDYMGLIRAHQMVEAGHRHDAYAMILNHAVKREQQQAVIDRLHEALEHWLRFRDGVARACVLKKP
ncbi:MAG: iron-containing redox enzyme family protein [Nitrospirae bacterium]|nr:iron-containing redox enzyme family protein [Nitrospirota bacterium]